MSRSDFQTIRVSAHFTLDKLGRRLACEHGVNPAAILRDHEGYQQAFSALTNNFTVESVKSVHIRRDCFDAPADLVSIRMVGDDEAETLVLRHKPDNTLSISFVSERGGAVIAPIQKGLIAEKVAGLIAAIFPVMPISGFRLFANNIERVSAGQASGVNLIAAASSIAKMP